MQTAKWASKHSCGNATDVYSEPSQTVYSEREENMHIFSVEALYVNLWINELMDYKNSLDEKLCIKYFFQINFPISLTQ